MGLGLAGLRHFNRESEPQVDRGVDELLNFLSSAEPWVFDSKQKLLDQLHGWIFSTLLPPKQVNMFNRFKLLGTGSNKGIEKGFASSH